MTSKRKQSSNALPFHGVIVAGSTKREAMDKYRAAVLGENAQVYVDEDRTMSFLSSAEAGGMALFNPQSGMLNLNKAPKLLARVNFVSESSGDLEANYTICSDGCGSHLVFDDDNIVSHCPVCASDLEELSDDELNKMNEDEDADGVMDELDDQDLDDLELAEESTSGDDADEDDADEGEDEGEDDSDDDDDDDEVVDVDLGDDDSDDDSDEDADEDADDEDADDDADDSSDDSGGEKSESAAEDDELEVIEAMDDDEDDEDDSDEDADMDIEVVDDEDGDKPETEASAEDYRGIVVTAKSRAAAIARYKKTLAGVDRVFHEDIVSENCIVATTADSEVNYNPESGEPTMIESDDVIENVEFSVNASDDGDVEVNLMLCSSDECGHYTLSDGDMSHCAVCGCKLHEPKAQAEDEGGDEDASDEDADAEDADKSEGEGGITNEGTKEETDDAEGEEKPDEDSDSDAEGEDKSESGTAQASVNLLKSTLNVAAAGGAVDADLLEVAYCGEIAGEKRWQAFYEGAPVAFATANSAKKHAHIFEGAAFGNAIVTGARHVGVAKILDEMGFQPVVAQVDLDRNIEAEVGERYAAQAAELQTKYDQQRDEYVDRFKAALATASQGVNRGFFKGMSNPVKGALWEAMNSVGIAQPEVLIDSAFKAHSDDYHKTIIDKAVEIMDKPLEVQNELAKSVEDTNYHEAQASAATSTVADKLAGVGTAPVEQKGKPSTAVAATESDDDDMSHMQSIVSGLGQRRR